VETVAHYKAYRAPTLARSEREKVTIVFGGLTWKHERLIQGALENLGYLAQPLPNIRKGDLDAGKELTDVGACCPTTFTTGNLVNFLRDHMQTEGKEQTLQKYAYVTAGSCGPCRFGQYHQSYELALRNSGLDAFRMFLLGQEGLDQGAARAVANGDGGTTILRHRIERHYRRNKIRAVNAGNDYGLVALHICDQGVGGSQVNSNYASF